MVEGVLPCHPHRAVSLMGGASVAVSSAVGQELRGRYLEPCPAVERRLGRAISGRADERGVLSALDQVLLDGLESPHGPAELHALARVIDGEPALLFEGA